MESPDSAPLVLIERAYNTWDIYEPGYNFGLSLPHVREEDRRYEKVCTVNGDLREALKVLHQLEAGR